MSGVPEPASVKPVTPPTREQIAEEIRLEMARQADIGECCDMSRPDSEGIFEIHGRFDSRALADAVAKLWEDKPIK